ncbi:MAG: serine hydrolase, partial [Bacteroidaceae bacterium]
KAYIDAQLGAIMVGHLEIPVLEPRKKMPSSLSRNVSTYLLKDELGFDGLVFTDALDMGGVNIQGKCLKALQAGADLLLVPRILRSEYDLIVQAINNGALSKDLIAKRCRKVLLYKYALGLNKKPYIEIPRLEQRINTPEAKDLIDRMKKEIEDSKSQKEKSKQITSSINPEAWTKIDSMIQDAVLQHAFPGCQLLIMKNGVALYDKNWGDYTYNRKKRVTSSTIYDLASMTKTSATLLGIMKLYDQGQLNLSDYASKFIPWLNNENTGKITIKELLFHESGLPATVSVSDILINPNSYDGNLFSRYRNSDHPTQIWTNQYIRKQYGFYPDYLSDHLSEKFPIQITEKLWASTSVRDSIFQRIAKKPLYSSKYRYSDLNFILLQQVVEAITREPMNQFVGEQFYVPMNMEETCFNPSTKFPTDLIAPTAYDAVIRGEVLQGYVHDELAAFLGGVSGNAGLFSTAHDQARIYQMLINKGTLDGQRYLSENTVNLFINVRSNKSRRGLGFDRPEPIYNKRGPLPKNAPRSMFGHLGFTGTCAWADPDNQLLFVFLSNRVYKDVWNPKLSKLNIRDKIEQIVYDNLNK